MYTARTDQWRATLLFLLTLPRTGSRVGKSLRKNEYAAARGRVLFYKIYYRARALSTLLPSTAGRFAALTCSRASPPPLSLSLVVRNKIFLEMWAKLSARICVSFSGLNFSLIANFLRDHDSTRRGDSVLSSYENLKRSIAFYLDLPTHFLRNLDVVKNKIIYLRLPSFRTLSY